MLDVGLSREELTDAIYATLRANDMTDGVHVRLMVTRGVKRTPYQDPRVTIGPATVVIIAEHKEPLPATVTDGITLFTTHVRRAAPDTLDPKLNAHSKLNDITACIQAYTAGADEALMLDPHGFVATCNSTHFFVVVGPDDAPEVLDLRRALLPRRGSPAPTCCEICRANGIPARETTFSLTDVYAAREAFVTGTFAGVVPVRTVDGRTIGDRRAAARWSSACRRCTASSSTPTSPHASRHERRRPRGDVVRPAQHLHGDDARVREPPRHRRRRRAAVRAPTSPAPASTTPCATRSSPPSPPTSPRPSPSLAAPLPPGATVHYAKHMAHHVSRDMDLALDPALPQRAADPRPRRGRRVLRARPGDLRARRHRPAPAGVAGRAVGRARRRRPRSSTRATSCAHPERAPALAVRLARHPVHRPDAVVAGGPA